MAENLHRGKISDEDVLEALQNTDAPFLTYVELAEILGVTRPALYGRMHRLNTDNPEVKCRQAGRSRVWWWEDE